MVYEEQLADEGISEAALEFVGGLFSCIDLSDIDLGRVGSTSFLVLNAVGALLPAFVLMPIAHRIGRVKTHALSLACMTAGYVGLVFFAHGPLHIYVLMAVLGIGWAAIMGIPYAMVSKVIPQERRGVYMGIVNMMIVIPMLIQTISFGAVIKNLLGNSAVNAIFFAGVFILIASVLAIRLNVRIDPQEGETSGEGG